MLNLTISKRTICLLFFIASIFSISSMHINPTYCFGFMCMLISMLFNNRYITKSELILLLYTILIAFIFIFGIKLTQKSIETNANFMSTYLYLYSLLLPLCFLKIFQKLEYKDRIIVYKKGYRFLIYFMFLDLLLRLVNVKQYDDFYSYKFGPLYFDSNFSGLMLLISLFFNDFLKIKKIIIISKKGEILLLLLLIFTFSRSALLVYILYKLIFLINSRVLKYILPIVLLLGSVFLGYLIYLYMIGFNFHFIDGSFNSKFYFIQLALQNYHSLPFLNKLFGIGLNNFQYISGGYFAHNILITFLYEFGLLGFLTSFIFIIYCYKKIGFNLNYILLPYITAGFSLFSAYNIFFFILLTCMLVECRKGNYA